MALIPFNDPNIDRIIDMDYEAWTDRLYEQAYGDHGERCINCRYFCEAYKDTPAFCEKDVEDDTEEDFDPNEYRIDRPEDDCCDDWEWNGDDNEPEVDY